MKPFEKFLKSSALVSAFLVLGVSNSKSAEPEPSPKLDIAIGDAFSRLKESIAKDESHASDHADEHEAKHTDSHSVHETGSGEHPETHIDREHTTDKHHEQSGDHTSHATSESHHSRDLVEDNHHPSGDDDVAHSINHGASESRAVADSHTESLGHPKDPQRSPYTSDVEKADYLLEQGDYAAAIKTYLNLLNVVDVPEVEHKKAMFGLAETYYKRGALAQSVSLLDQYLEKFPKDERRADILFQIGLLYREMRLYPEAVTSFYRVLNSIVLTGESDLPKYLALARRAQFETARSHFYGEQWEQALVLLNRIELFELSETDRESLLFYQAHATLRMGDKEKGLKLVQKLIHTYPSSPLVPEMLYTKAETLAQMQQTEDSVATLMELLEYGGMPSEEAGEEWRYWRQQAGNEFANRYFDNKDFLAALRVYQGIAVLDDRAEWQLPIIYQMGLCFEKLGMYDRAVESLEFVAQGVEQFNQTEGKSSDVAMDQLLKRTEWRLDMLNWRAGLERDRFPMLANRISDLESEEEE